MDALIKSVIPGSPASRTIICPGDTLKKINGHTVSDVLDYKFHSCDARLILELTSPAGKLKLVRLRKPEGADIGLEFGTYLMDRERSCANNCVFCFIDQLPRGLRKTLYYKDDDVRLSFLQGNYITLTNLSKREVERIIDLRISPINVSVHTLNQELRSYMLGNKRGGTSLAALYAFAEAGLTLNCQIVCCPGINDGAELQRTMEGFLQKLTRGVRSVSVVPVGLTKYRDGLAQLRPFDRELARKTVAQVDAFGERCLKKLGTRLFYCADEFYIKAGLELPPDGYYEGYPQLENGVGMMRLLITEFYNEMANTPVTASAPMRKPFSIATGAAAGKYLTNLSNIAAQKYGTIGSKVYTIDNDFFGSGVTVAGLITGGDIIRQLSGRELGDRLLIPINMLRSGEDVFLDDVTVPELSGALGVPVRVVAQDGAELLRAMLGG